MTDPLNEQLSACLDGELSPAELELLLKRLSRDAELGQTASRYSAIGAVMRDGQGPIARVDFAARVATAVAAEKMPAKPVDLRRWARPALTAAMAAGVAVFAVLIANQPDTPVPQPVASDSVPSTYAVPASAATPVNFPAERLTNYVVAHSEYSSPLGRPMVLNGVLADQTIPEEQRPPAAPADNSP